MKDKALTYLRNLGLITQDKTQFVVRFPDGREVDFVQILADFALSHESINNTEIHCPSCDGMGKTRIGEIGQFMPPVLTCRQCNGTGRVKIIKVQTT